MTSNNQRRAGGGRPLAVGRTRRPESAGASAASSPGVRSRMKLQRTRDTGPELAVRRILHAQGLRYRVDRAPIPGLRRRCGHCRAGRYEACYGPGWPGPNWAGPSPDCCTPSTPTPPGRPAPTPPPYAPPAGWLRHRMSAWLDEHGQPLPAPGVAALRRDDWRDAEPSQGVAWVHDAKAKRR